MHIYDCIIMYADSEPVNEVAEEASFGCQDEAELCELLVEKEEVNSLSFYIFNLLPRTSSYWSYIVITGYQETKTNASERKTKDKACEVSSVGENQKIENWVCISLTHSYAIIKMLYNQY